MKLDIDNKTTTIDKCFRDKIFQHKFYIYVLIDSSNNKIFYITCS